MRSLCQFHRFLLLYMDFKELSLEIFEISLMLFIFLWILIQVFQSFYLLAGAFKLDRFRVRLKPSRFHTSRVNVLLWFLLDLILNLLCWLVMLVLVLRGFCSFRRTVINFLFISLVLRIFLIF